MALRIYSTLSRRVEPFVPIQPGEVRMYVCGPTVYDHAHVGHAMSTLVYDIIRRYMEWQGYRFIHAMNYTDVDDKIIIRAQKLGMDPLALAEQYIAEYQEHIKALNVLPPTVTPRATREVAGMITIIQSLMDKGYAYAANGDVYFRVAQDADYGRLSGRRTDELLAGARVDVSEQKENPLDFALWKAAKPGEPSWDSPWGPGRPGWHIECSAMCLHYLGEQLDIHGGGNDLIFPHHENEIAQSESFTESVPFARYWVHNGMLQLKDEKMSKSLGNFVTIGDYLKAHSADSLRMLVLQSHYRAPIAFGDESIANAQRALERLAGGLRPPTGNATTGEAVAALRQQATASKAGFIEAMDNDFNTAGALAHLFDLVREINTARDAGIGGEPFAEAQATLRELTGVLGLTLEQAQTPAHDAAPFIELLIETRAQLRQAKQFALADGIRDKLLALGVALEDGPKGTTWRKA